MATTTDPLPEDSPGFSPGPGAENAREKARARSRASRRAYVSASDAVVTQLETLEKRIRQAEAERMVLLAEALDLSQQPPDESLQHERDPESACRCGCAFEQGIDASEVYRERLDATEGRHNPEMKYREIRADIAAALRVSERTVDRQISQASTVAHDYREVLNAFTDGLVSYAHTTVIADAGLIIGSGDSAEVVARRAAYEQQILGIAVHETPGRLRPIARRIAEQYADVPLDERHAIARRERRVYLVDGEDGMTDLIAHLPAAVGHAIFRDLTRAAVELQQVEHEHPRQTPREGTPSDGVIRDGAALTIDDELPRSRDQVRADLLADLLSDLLLKTTSGDAGDAVGHPAQRVAASVQVVIPVGVLDRKPTSPASLIDELELDFDDLPPPEPPPPLLDGYGPIDSETALMLASYATHWKRVRAQEMTNEVLSVDRYRPSEEIKRFLVARDMHCRFPGCRIPTARCDIDHTVDAARGGPTTTRNLGHLCRSHHTLKHQTGWRTEQHHDGTYAWTSPTGRTYRDRPASRVAFAPVLDTGDPLQLMSPVMPF
ncbi:MAG: DUF222 domain-containing protein [Leucobacter sp.]